MSTDLHSGSSTEPQTNDHALRELLDVQRSDFLRCGSPSVAVRRDRLDRLILLLTESADEFSEALCADFGNRPHVVNLLNDIAGILPDLTQTRRKVAQWMKSDQIRSSWLLGLPTAVDKKPLGVIGVIGPWNFPVGLVAQPAASALAAGNRVIAKLSEVTPRTSRIFAEKVADYFDPTEFTVVNGGPDVGAAFSALPFDHLFFTGSPGVGALVASAAAKNLVPVTLELGGKNPAVVAQNADVAAMGRRVMAGRMANGGQICLCPDYAFVPADRIDTFVDAALDTARTAVTAENGKGVVTIVNDKNYQRISDLIEDARQHGATIKDTGTTFDSGSRRIPPTIVLDLDDEMAIAREEVFGPVLSVLPYGSIDEVCDYVSARPSPLAAYWYGPNDNDFETFRTHTISGGITVNDFALHCALMVTPFGGVGRSGWGAYHGKTGFDTFTHRRSVTVNRLPFSIAELMLPPYSAALKAGASAYIRQQRFLARRRTARRP